MKLAVSACLLGENVRYDGGHKRDRFITDQLSNYSEFISFCPEAMAFGTPRPSIRMVVKGEEISILSNKDGADLTQKLQEFSNKELSRIAEQELCGIIFKSKSPSCGLNSSKTYLANGFSEGKRNGMFAGVCHEYFDYLPMEEEGRLEDDWLRENFIMQIFAYEAVQKLQKSASNMKELVSFHTKYKFMLQAKDEKLYREMGKLVGNHEERSFTEVLSAYVLMFKQAIAKKVHANAIETCLSTWLDFLKMSFQR